MSGSIKLEPGEVIIIALAVLIAALWWTVIRLYRRMIAWQAIAYTMAEADWEYVQQWEIRAMAAFLFDTLPSWASGIRPDWEFEELAVSEWRKGALWYGEHEPRLNSELFGEDDLASEASLL